LTWRTIAAPSAFARSWSTPRTSEPACSGSAWAGGGVVGGASLPDAAAPVGMPAPGAAAADSSGRVSAPALAAASSAVIPPAATVAVAGSGSPDRRCCRQSENCDSRRFEMSLIMPPRPNEARRPVIVKSVSASTRVPPASVVLSVLTIVAVAPPWPRLSVPFAASVARWAASSISWMRIVPR
jgi:hypothetical protein